MTRSQLPALPIDGGCACGAIRYRVHAMPRMVSACHCRECQRQSGSAYGMAMTVGKAELEILQGDTARYVRAAPEGRSIEAHFCARCGVRVWHASSGSPDRVNVKPGTLDDPSWLVPAAHYWTARAMAGTILPKDQLLFDFQPDGWQAIAARWRDVLGGATRPSAGGTGADGGKDAEG